MPVPLTGRKARTNDGRSPVKRSEAAHARLRAARAVRALRRARKLLTRREQW